MKLIDKDKVIVEIERRIKEGEAVVENVPSSAILGLIQAYKNVLSFLDSLSVKEVDLEKHLKEETELLKVKGFLVRDKDDYTAIYAEKPHRGKTEWVNGNGSCLMTINDARLVPDIEFEDEPVEVEVTLKRV